MKVTDKHFQILQDAISVHDTETVREQYRKGEFARADVTKDLNKRYRWDLYWYAVRVANYNGQMPMPDHNDGYTMDHLDTALRRIVKAL